MSKMPDRGKERGRPLKSMGEHKKFLSRITKTLYYGKLPKTDRLSFPVSEIASELFSEAHQGQSLNRLYCEDASNISRNACVSPCSFVLALIYLERLKDCNPEYVQQVAPSKLFLISLMVSSKFLHDDGEEDEVFIDEWAKSGEISIPELGQLERDFLKAIDWDVFVREPIFWSRLKQLETDVALRQGSKRGWFTYTELQQLNCGFAPDFLHDFLNSLIVISAALAATYAVGVLTLAGSVFLASQIPGTALHPALNSLREFPGQNYNTLDLVLPLELRNSTKDPFKPLVLPSGGKNALEMDFLAVEQITPDEMNRTVEKGQRGQFGAINPVHVLKTGLILASITYDNSDSSQLNAEMPKCLREKCLGQKFDNPIFPASDFSDSGSDLASDNWAWWTHPILKWLSDVSQPADKYTLKLPHNYCKNFAQDKLLDMSIAGQKKWHLEDKIHKATRVRLQEQMERSWHEEWTDSVLTTFRPYWNPVSAF